MKLCPRLEQFHEHDKSASATDASHRLLEDANPWSAPVSDFSGHKRPHQPEGGKFPTLSSHDGMKRGAQGSDKSAKEVDKYMTPEAHKEALASLVHIRTPFTDGRVHDKAKGSGTIIGHGNDVTYVATVDHNTADYNDDRSNVNGNRPVLREGPIKVEMPNGKEYEARRATLKDEKGTDRSVLIVHTGTDTGSFHEARIADAPQTGPGFGIGFPQDATSPYVSTLEAQGDHVASKKEIQQGARQEMTVNKGHTEQGMSGGGMYTRDGSLYSMDEANNGTHTVFDGVPIRQKDVERWKKELPQTW